MHLWSQAPRIDVDTSHIVCKGDCAQFRIDNSGSGDAFFVFRGYGGRSDKSSQHNNTSESLALPVWLNVLPTCGRVPAGGHVTVIFYVNKPFATMQCKCPGNRSMEVRALPC